MQQVPDGLQNFIEWLIESLYGFLEGIIGPHLVKRTFWFFATIFIFILSANWIGLVPGVGSLGWGQQTAEGFRLQEPLFRGANADVNLTLAMALVFFASWIVWGLQRKRPAEGDPQGELFCAERRKLLVCWKLPADRWCSSQPDAWRSSRSCSGRSR